MFYPLPSPMLLLVFTTTLICSTVNIQNSALSTMVQIFPLFFLILLIIITVIKKKRQIGKTWNGPLSAKVVIAGKELSCRHCEGKKFQKREGILVTSLVCFFQLNFWNRSASCYTCINCGHVEWFVGKQEEKIEIERDFNTK